MQFSIYSEYLPSSEQKLWKITSLQHRIPRQGDNNNQSVHPPLSSVYFLVFAWCSTALDNSSGYLQWAEGQNTDLFWQPVSTKGYRERVRWDVWNQSQATTGHGQRGHSVGSWKHGRAWQWNSWQGGLGSCHNNRRSSTAGLTGTRSELCEQTGPRHADWASYIYCTGLQEDQSG